MPTPWDTKQLFDLSKFAHKDLFSAVAPPWHALTQLKDFCRSIKGNIAYIDLPPGVWIVNPESVFIGPGTTIESGAYIAGPCVIGSNCEIRHGAYIRGHVVTGDRCVVGHTSELKNCILLNGAKAAHFAYVGDSILGNEVNLGAGTKCANLKLRRSNIVIRYADHVVDTGLQKLGAILGDHVQIGCNAVTNPGTIVGPHSIWMPCLNGGGFFPAHSTIK